MTSPFSIAVHRSAAFIAMSLLVDDASNSSLRFRAFSKMVSKCVTPFVSNLEGCERLEGARLLK